MKNYSIVTVVIFSTFYITSLHAGQKDLPESLVVDRLTKIGQLVGEINKTKIGFNTYLGVIEQNISGGTYIIDALNTISKYLSEITDSLSKSDKKTHMLILQQLSKQSNNPLFKIYISLLSKNQNNNFFIASTYSSLEPLESDISINAYHYEGKSRPVKKQDFINFVKSIITKLGYNPSEFIKLNQ